MKMREVVLRAIAQRITWDQAADIVGVSPQAMWRLRALYARRGYDGFWVRAARKPRGPCVPFATVEKVLLLYQRKYAHLDPRSFHEKLSKKHAIDLSYEWVERALRESGLLSQARDPEARL